MQKLADVLFPSCCPVFEDLCAHLDDAAIRTSTDGTFYYFAFNDHNGYYCHNLSILYEGEIKESLAL